MPYDDLDDESKLNLAIQFVAQDQPIPPALELWLIEVDMYDLIVNPGGTDE